MGTHLEVYEDLLASDMRGISCHVLVKIFSASQAIPGRDWNFRKLKNLKFNEIVVQ